MPDYKLVDGVRFVDPESEFASKAVNRLYQYWLENRRDDGLIGATSFVIEKHPDILRDFVIVDVVGECEDLRVRFMGSELADRYPDGTGKLLRDVVPPGLWLERTFKICHAVFVTRQVLVNGPGPATFPGLEHLAIEGLYVPMTLGGGNVDRILVVNAFLNERSEIGRLARRS